MPSQLFTPMKCASAPKTRLVSSHGSTSRKHCAVVLPHSTSYGATTCGSPGLRLYLSAGSMRMIAPVSPSAVSLSSQPRGLGLRGTLERKGRSLGLSPSPRRHVDLLPVLVVRLPDEGAVAPRIRVVELRLGLRVREAAQVLEVEESILRHAKPAEGRRRQAPLLARQDFLVPHRLDGPAGVVRDREHVRHELDALADGGLPVVELVGLAIEALVDVSQLAEHLLDPRHGQTHVREHLVGGVVLGLVAVDLWPEARVLPLVGADGLGRLIKPALHEVAPALLVRDVDVSACARVGRVHLAGRAPPARLRRRAVVLIRLELEAERRRQQLVDRDARVGLAVVPVDVGDQLRGVAPLPKCALLPGVLDATVERLVRPEKGRNREAHVLDAALVEENLARLEPPHSCARRARAC
eukprot:7391800-Prymnesium_polylepis.1